jgi:hypothetical protein
MDIIYKALSPQESPIKLEIFLGVFIKKDGKKDQ